MTMALSPQLSTHLHFIDSRVISLDLDLSAAAPEKMLAQICYNDCGASEDD